MKFWEVESTANSGKGKGPLPFGKGQKQNEYKRVKSIGNSLRWYNGWQNGLGLGRSNPCSHQKSSGMLLGQISQPRLLLAVVKIEERNPCLGCLSSLKEMMGYMCQK